MSRVRVTPPHDPYFTYSTVLEVRAVNSCGATDWKRAGTLSASMYYSLFANPNPAKGILNVNIEVDKELYSQMLKGTVIIQKQSIAAKNYFQQNTNFTVRLFSSSGVMVRQVTCGLGSIQLDISNLQNGTYVLHVYNVKMLEPLTQIILISN